MTILSGPQKVRDIIPLEFGRELTKKQRQLERVSTFNNDTLTEATWVSYENDYCVVDIKVYELPEYCF